MKLSKRTRKGIGISAVAAALGVAAVGVSASAMADAPEDDLILDVEYGDASFSYDTYDGVFWLADQESDNEIGTRAYIESSSDSTSIETVPPEEEELLELEIPKGDKVGVKLCLTDENGEDLKCSDWQTETV